MKKAKKALLRIIIGRTILFVLILLLQLFLIAGVLMFFSKNLVWMIGGFTILSMIVTIWIVNNEDNPMYKLAWIIPIITLPIFGTLLYLYYKMPSVTNRIAKRHKMIVNKTNKYLTQDEKVLSEVETEDPYVKSMFSYIAKSNNYPVYKNTRVKYLKVGEVFFDSLKEELEKAKDFIFIEFFIISYNSMWKETFEILKRKAKEGVEIRILFDAMGSFFTLPYEYKEVIRGYGIKCEIFSPVKPILSSYHNNRDHRKIVVIDGKTAYNGGINLSDEYINVTNEYGHWKDTAIKIEGEAVKNLTMMFLQMWDIFSKEESNYLKYITENHVKSDGYVTCYGDSPLDEENVGEQVYLDIINSSKRYVYITTPYLIIDFEMASALKHAAKRNVDTVVIVPHISDGKSVKRLGYSYYKELIKAGVKIYEYTPGFVHAKMFISDAEKAVVGTINLDYRSLYLHFECATLMYKNSEIRKIEKDFNDMIKVSEKITLEKFNKISKYERIY
ncbi:MAG: cardiolipin synthase, partial [Bacilli bacterium]